MDQKFHQGTRAQLISPLCDICRDPPCRTDSSLLTPDVSTEVAALPAQTPCPGPQFFLFRESWLLPRLAWGPVRLPGSSPQASPHTVTIGGRSHKREKGVRLPDVSRPRWESQTPFVPHSIGQGQAQASQIGGEGDKQPLSLPMASESMCLRTQAFSPGSHFLSPALMRPQFRQSFGHPTNTH